MKSVRTFSLATLFGGLVLLSVACGGENKSLEPPPHTSQALAVLGNGPVEDRFTGEVWSLGSVAYTTT